MENKVIGTFCSTAKEGTIIMPKSIPGYISPEGQVLKENGQKFEFVYTPIKYNIFYELSGGEISEQKKLYTIEDESYYPPDPIREGHTFDRWEPSHIEAGSYGDITFKAIWKTKAILLPGKELNKTIDEYTGKGNILSIKRLNSKPEKDYINISSTDTPIYAYYANRVLYIYCDEDIYCNDNMIGAFEDFILLNDIDSLSTWICNPGTNINSLFKNCTMLSNVSGIENWAGGIFFDFTEALFGTLAASSGRVPDWYKWKIKLVCNGKSKILEEKIVSVIPNERIYLKNFAGYTCPIKYIDINEEKTYELFYEPIFYAIKYETYGGIIVNQKLNYTIEDESYYPPDPIKEGYTFDRWDPVCINTGDYGDITFFANYK